MKALRKAVVFSFKDLTTFPCSCSFGPLFSVPWCVWKEPQHCTSVIDPVISRLHELPQLPLQPGNGEQTVLMEKSLKGTLTQIYF